MKIFLVVFSALFLMKSCSESKSLNEVKIKYVAETRGYYKAVEIKNKRFYVINTRNGEPKEILLNKEEWKLLIGLFNDIDINNFENLIGETKQREFDKKPFGNLFITKNNKTIQTKGFDHTIPPKEIKSFVDLILKYSKKE